MAGFEPTTSSSRTTRATGLRYTPHCIALNSATKIWFFYKNAFTFLIYFWKFARDKYLALYAKKLYSKTNPKVITEGKQLFRPLFLFSCLSFLLFCMCCYHWKFTDWHPQRSLFLEWRCCLNISYCSFSLQAEQQKISVFRENALLSFFYCCTQCTLDF